MSVLFKALQKAEKENEQRQTTSGGSGFDAGRLAGSGAIKLAGGRGVNWRVAGMAAVGVLAVAITGAFLFVSSAPTSSPTRVAMSPPMAKPAAPGTTEAIPILQPPANAEAVPPQPEPAAAEQVAAAPPAAAPAASEPPASGSSAQPATADAAPAPKPEPAPVAKAATPAASPPPARREAMPEIAVDSPARMLNPPIAIQRAEFELSGVGKAVQVREVSQQAQNNVGAGYNALVRGAYEMALGFYDSALKDEPTSVLALLGRGSALQKLGDNEQAHAAYQKVLKIDAGNREALSNLTMLVAERSPAEALTQLLDLEKQYPSFSPVKAQIGLTYAKMGSMPEALDYLNRAATLSPESVMYQYNMALVLDHLGRTDQAVEVYQRVLNSLSTGRGTPELSSTDIERRVRYLRAR